MTNTYELFAKIIESKGITPYRVAKETGLTTVLFTDWKKGKSKPKYDKLKIIADFLGVSVEYLQGIETEQQEILNTFDSRRGETSRAENTLSEQEKAILAAFRETTEEGRLRIIQAIMNIRDRENGIHTIYRAANSPEHEEHRIEQRAASDMSKFKNATPVTREEDL